MPASTPALNALPCLYFPVLQFTLMTPKSRLVLANDRSRLLTPSRSPSISVAPASRPCSSIHAASRLASASAFSHRKSPHRMPSCASSIKLRAQLPNFDRVSVGFPGVIKHGVTYTAVNLNPRWAKLPAAARTRKALEEAGPRRQRCVRARLWRHQRPRRRTCSHARHRHGFVALYRRQALPWPRARPSSLEENDLRGLPGPPRPRNGSAKSTGTSCSAKPSRKPRPPSTGTTSTSVVATPKRSTSNSRPT